MNRSWILFSLLSIIVSLDARTSKREDDKYGQYELRKKRDSIDDLHSPTIDPLAEIALGSAPIFRRKKRDGDNDENDDERQFHEKKAAGDSIKSAGYSIQAAAHDIEASSGRGFKGRNQESYNTENNYRENNENNYRGGYQTMRKTIVDQESQESTEDDDGYSNNTEDSETNNETSKSQSDNGPLNKILAKSSALAEEISTVFKILRKREEQLMTEMENLKKDVKKAIRVLKSAEDAASKNKNEQ